MSHDRELEAALRARSFERASDVAAAAAADPDAELRTRWVESVRVLSSLASGELVAAVAWSSVAVLPDPRVCRALADELTRRGEHELAAEVAWSLAIDEEVVELPDLDEGALTRNASRLADFWLAHLRRWPLDATARSAALAQLGIAGRAAEAGELARRLISAGGLDDLGAAAVASALVAAGARGEAERFAEATGTASCLAALADAVGDLDSDPAAATRWFERAMAADPRDAEVISAFVAHLHRAGDVGRARELELVAESLQADELG